MASPLQVQCLNATTGGTTSATLTKAYSGAQTSGNANIVTVFIAGSTTLPTSVVDTENNAYSLIASRPDSNADSGVWAVYACFGIVSAGAGANTVTVTLPATKQFWDIYVFEYSSCVGFDLSSGAGSTSNGTALACSITTSSTNETILWLQRAAAVVTTTLGGALANKVSGTYSLVADDEAASTATTYNLTSTISASATWNILTVALWSVAPTFTNGFVQANHTDNSSSSTTTTVNFTRAQTHGNLNLLWIAVPNTSAIASVVDTSGNAYTPVLDANGNAAVVTSTTYNDTWSLYYAPNIAAAAAFANTVTVTYTVAVTNQWVVIMEYTGYNTASPIDGYSGLVTNIAGTLYTPGSVITTQANDVIVSFSACQAVSTLTVPSGFTSRLTGTFTYTVSDGAAATAGFYNPYYTSSVSARGVCQAVALSTTAGSVPALTIPNGLATLPPMGWDSWRKYGTGATQTEIQTQASALVSTGLSALGYTLVNANDCIYFSTARTGNNLTPQANFTNVPAMASFITGQGLGFAAYLESGCPGSGCGSQLPSTGWETYDVAAIAAQGATYLMYDSCFDPGNSATAQLYERAMAVALQRSGSNIVFLVSAPNYTDGTSYGSGSLSWAASIGGNIVWSEPDQLTPITYAKMVTIYQSQVGRARGAKQWNLPDFMTTGNGTVSTAEGRTSFCMTAILASPMWITADLTTIGATDLTTLSNTEVIAINQDSAGITGTQVSHVSVNAGTAFVDVWARQLSGGKWAIVLMNQDTGSQTISATWSMFSQLGPYTVRDVLAHSNLGTMNSGVSATVASHDVAMYLLTPTTPPVVVGSLGQFLQNYNPYHAQVKLNNRWYAINQLLNTLNRSSDSRLSLAVEYVPGASTAQVLNVDGSLNVQLVFDIPHN